MELVIKHKETKKIYKCLPGFINILKDWRFIVRDGPHEQHQNMKDYNIYIAQEGLWLDLIYAYQEGFIEPSELRSWL